MKVSTGKAAMALIEGARRETGKSQRQVSLDAGYSHATYNFALKNHGKVLVDTIAAFGRVVGIDIEMVRSK